MALPPAFLDELRARTPLPPLIGRKVRLARNGRQWKGCCPFHNEKTPSFYVYDDHYHCFGCGQHGDAIGFTMQTEGLPFREAVERLAAEAGLEVPRDAIPTSRFEAADVVRNILDDLGPISKATGTGATQFNEKVLDALLATTARLLVTNNKLQAAHLLANAGIYIQHTEYDRWDGGQDHWLLGLQLPADSFFALGNRESLEVDIKESLSVCLKAISQSDFINVEIGVLVEQDTKWREKTLRHTAGEGVTNQGRVRSDNIATREQDGLLFRSEPEVHFYNALKRLGVPFAPLPVVLSGGLEYRRIEPDFIIYAHGLLMIVEIDVDSYHTEKPAAAHARLKFMLDNGAKLERITASACDTPAKAIEAAKNVLGTIEKLLKAR